MRPPRVNIYAMHDRAAYEIRLFCEDTGLVSRSEVSWEKLMNSPNLSGLQNMLGQQVGNMWAAQVNAIGQQNALLRQQNDLAQITQRITQPIQSVQKDSGITAAKLGLKPKKEEKPKMLQPVRDYLKKHQDAFMTIAIAILVDHFIFNGAFRKKIEGLVERVLDGAAKRLEKSNNE